MKKYAAKLETELFEKRILSFNYIGNILTNSQIEAIHRRAYIALCDIYQDGRYNICLVYEDGYFD